MIPSAPSRSPALRACRALALLLPGLLAACASQPLLEFDRIAVAPVEGATEAGGKTFPVAGFEKALERAVREETRFGWVSGFDALPPRTALVHPRLLLAEAPVPGSTTAARLDYLFTDPGGTPILRKAVLSFSSAGRPVEESAAGDFIRLLHRTGGRPLGAPTPLEEPPAGEAILPAPPAPASPARPAPGGGRTFLRLRFSVSPPSDGRAGEGRDAPEYDRVFHPGTGLSLDLGRALAPGLEVGLGAGLDDFEGKDFESAGLSVRFETLRLGRVHAGARLLLPLSGPSRKRWMSFWDPFADTRGILIVADLRAGAAIHEDLHVRVLADESGEVPAWTPGDRIRYYRGGALFFVEGLVGAGLRLGSGKPFLVEASVLAGWFLATAPAPTGPGSESEPFGATPLCVELALRF